MISGYGLTPRTSEHGYWISGRRRRSMRALFAEGRIRRFSSSAARRIMNSGSSRWRETNRARSNCSIRSPHRGQAPAVDAELPTNIIRLSKSPLPPLRVFAWLQPRWSSPRFAETSDITFQVRDSLGGKVGETVVPALLLSGALNVEYASPLAGGVYVGKYRAGCRRDVQSRVSPVATVRHRCKEEGGRAC